MKKRIFIGIFILIVSIVSICNTDFQSRKANLPLFSSANIEALAKDGESSSGKEKCKQDKVTNPDPLNGTPCASGDRNSSVRAFKTTYTCIKGSGSNCKEGTVYTGHDCNTDFDGSESGLRVVCP